MTDIGRLRKNWETFADSDALWAVLTRPDRRGRWDSGEFFATGRAEIAGVFRRLESLGIPVGKTSALDFGCGVGRLSRALADRFDSVEGVDVAQGMIDRAREFHTEVEGLSFRVNDRPDLAVFPSASFDFIYSSITLQHIPPALSKGYLREFLRVLRPGGTAVFQLPAANDDSTLGRLHRLLPLCLVNMLRRLRYGTPAVMEMHAVPRCEVESLVAECGGEIVAILPDRSTGAGWVSWRYVVRRAEA